MKLPPTLIEPGKQGVVRPRAAARRKEKARFLGPLDLKLPGDRILLYFVDIVLRPHLTISLPISFNPLLFLYPNDPSIMDPYYPPHPHPPPSSSSATLSPQSPPTNTHTNLNVFRPRRSDDWHEYREIIEQLYRNDQLKLRDVKRIMERDYNFFASYCSLFFQYIYLHALFSLTILRHLFDLTPTHHSPEKNNTKTASLPGTSARISKPSRSN